MKFNIGKLVSSFAILLAVGCSARIITMPTSAPAITNVPISSPVATPILSPFIGKIAFMYSNGTGYYYHIYLMNADSSVVKDLTPSNLPLINSLNFSPDGESITFTASIEGKSQIFTMKIDGSNLKQLTFGEQDSFSPSWSPDGKYILFESSDKGILDDRHIVSLQAVLAVQIYLIKSDGSEMRRLKVDSKDNNITMGGFYRKDGLIAVSEPVTRYANTNYIVNYKGIIQKQYPEFWTTAPVAWSPDGNFVIYSPSRVESDCFGLLLKKFDNSETRCLKIDKDITIHNDGQVIGAYGISWSPDSAYIIFSSNFDGDYDLYIIKADGTELTQLTNLPGDESEPVWSAMP